MNCKKLFLKERFWLKNEEKENCWPQSFSPSFSLIHPCLYWLSAWRIKKINQKKEHAVAIAARVISGVYLQHLINVCYVVATSCCKAKFEFDISVYTSTGAFAKIKRDVVHIWYKMCRNQLSCFRRDLSRIWWGMVSVCFSMFINS